MLSKTSLLLVLAPLFGVIAFFALSENPVKAPGAPAAKPEKSSSQTKPALSRIFGEIQFYSNAHEQKAAKTVPLKSFWRRFDKESKHPPLSAAQLKRHIEMRGQSAASLLNALRISANLDYLREAYDRYPDNPDVLLELAMRSESPEERREAIEAIRKIDPDWGLPAYLLALEQLKGGDRQAAMHTLSEAGSSKFLDYSPHQKWEDSEQVYRDNGFPLHEAKFLGFMSATLPSLTPLLELSKEMASLQLDFLKKGDTTCALQLAEAARSLNQKNGKRPLQCWKTSWGMPLRSTC